MSLSNLEIIVSPDVIAEEIQLGETLLMDVKTMVYFGLDTLGTSVWRAIQVSSSTAEVFEKVASGSDIPMNNLEAKFQNILQGLERSKLIELKPR